MVCGLKRTDSYRSIMASLVNPTVVETGSTNSESVEIKNTETTLTTFNFMKLNICNMDQKKNGVYYHLLIVDESSLPLNNIQLRELSQIILNYTLVNRKTTFTAEKKYTIKSKSDNLILSVNLDSLILGNGVDRVVLSAQVVKLYKQKIDNCDNYYIYINCDNIKQYLKQEYENSK